MKLINQEIQVQTDEQRLPVAIFYKGRSHAIVSIGSTWLVQGEWWLDFERKGRSRRHYRVTLATNRSVEITREGGVWKLAKMLD